MNLSAQKVRNIINNTIISSLFIKGGTCDPVVALNKLNATKQDNNTYILNGCTIIINPDQPFKYTVHKIK